MDFNRSWSKTAEITKRTPGHLTNGLNVLSPLCAPFAARWDAEATRRKSLRTPENLRKLMDAQKNHMSARSTAATAKARKQTLAKSGASMLSPERRAARTADKAARQQARQTLAKLKEAKANYPDTMRAAAVKGHAVHAVPAGITSAVLSTSQDWTIWPASVSASLIALNVGALWLGRRAVTAQVEEEGLSAEERRLMERLDPSWWVQHAAERGLDGTVTSPPEMTAAGIVCGVRLDGRWKAPKLAAEADAVRALLGMRTETRMEISRGSHGDRALIVIRTRSASDGVSMIWTPDHVGIGVDEVTGEFVELPLAPGKHVLAAGRTGMGKSVSWRPLAMRALMAEDWTAVVIDPKRQEAIGWGHCLRCVGQETNREERMARIYGMAKELTREMHRRQGIATGATWVPDGRPENRNLLVVIDEGAAIVRMSKRKEYGDVLDLFEELWSEARSVGFQFVWATQFPTKAVGVPAAVKENMSAFLSLTVNPGEAERAIFGETAQQEGWLPSRLDGVQGRALLQFGKRKPDPLRLWHVTDGMVAALPKADPWHSPEPTAAVPAVPQQADAPRTLTLVKTELAPAPQLTESEAKVLAALEAAPGPQRHRDVVEAAGMAKATVSKALTGLIEHGLVVRDGQTYAAAAEEATA